MLLTDLLSELAQVDIGIVGRWEMHGKKGVMLGDPGKSFPNPTGPQYPVDCTKEDDPDLTEAAVRAIRRCFGIEEA